MSGNGCTPDRAEIQSLLGYHDIRTGNRPDARLLKFIGTDLPNIFPEASSSWLFRRRDVTSRHYQDCGASSLVPVAFSMTPPLFYMYLEVGWLPHGFTTLKRNSLELFPCAA